MSAAPGRLLLGDVAVGDALPPLRHEVTATTIVLGALAARDWRPMHHDHHFAVHRNGTRDIFMNTPNQAAWFERYLTDWTGPTGRLGHMAFRMRGSVFPGDTMTLTGTVADVATDAAGCGWVTVDVALHADDGSGPRLATTCRARIAVPASPDDNPWTRRGPDWIPD
jgi:acyl dehydratase